jgi:hypothetical protein
MFMGLVDTFLFELCAKSMQNKIKSRTDFAQIINDPIKLLQANRMNVVVVVITAL